MSDFGELKARAGLPPVPSAPAPARDEAEEAEELRDTIAELRLKIADLQDEICRLNCELETEPEPLWELRSAVEHIAWRARLDGQWPIAQELERAVEASR